MSRDIRLGWLLRMVTTATLLVGVSASLWVAVKSLALRPAGDDYCWAVGAGYGPVGAPGYWWETFSGYVIHNVSLTYLVGMPLFHLPLSIASAVPFLIAAAAVAVAALVPLVWASRVIGSRRWLAVLVVPLVMISWWVYWWFPMTQQQDGTNLWLAVSMVHNQNINGGYVIETTVCVLIWLFAWLVSRRSSGWSMVLFVAGGAWAAFSGPALAVASFLMLGASLVWWWWLSAVRRRAVGIGLGVGMVSTAAFSLVAHLAPGTQARASRMGTSLDLSPTRIGEWVNHVFPGTIEIWFDAFTTPGVLIVLWVAVVMGFMAGGLGIPLATPVMGRLVLAGAGFSLMLAVASGVTNFFIYSAPYHAVPSRILAFISIWWAGAWVGSYLSQRLTTAPVVGAVLLAGLIAMAASIGVVLNMTIAISERATQWDRGPAPVSGIVTDYLTWPDGRTCWQDLIQIRDDLPDRGQEPPPYVFDLDERLPVLT